MSTVFENIPESEIRSQLLDRPVRSMYDISYIYGRKI